MDLYKTVCSLDLGQRTADCRRGTFINIFSPCIRFAIKAARAIVFAFGAFYYDPQQQPVLRSSEGRWAIKDLKAGDVFRCGSREYNSPAPALPRP